MDKVFFQQYGNKICFQDENDILSKFSQIDCSVPDRTEGRKSWHRERYCLQHYLLALSNNNLLKFPLSIMKNESPDFIITHGNAETVGLEVTDGTTEVHEEAKTEMAKRNKNGEVTFLEGEKHLVVPNQKLMGKGWDGNEVEREWCKIISNTIKIKTEKLQVYSNANKYELLIYDNTHLGILNIDVKVALPLIKDAYKGLNIESFEKVFHCISVITKSDKILLYDIANNGNVLQIFS